MFYHSVFSFSLGSSKKIAAPGLSGHAPATGKCFDRQSASVIPPVAMAVSAFLSSTGSDRKNGHFTQKSLLMAEW